MKKIKVAFFADILIEDFDGASRTMFQIIRRIPALRFEFLFICGVGPERLFGFDCVRLPSLSLPLNNTYKMALPAFAQTRLREELEKFSPDIVHIATPSLLGQFALKYARKWQVPVLSIYHTHFISYIDYYLKHLPFAIPFVKDLVKVAQNGFYNQCDKVYIPSESIAGELVAGGVKPDCIKIWKRGVDTDLFSPGERDVKWMRNLCGNDYPTILFASRLVWEKNLETLIAVYRLMRKSGHQFNLVVAGDGVAAEACRMRMPGAVFLGKADHPTLARLYASSDVFLFTSVSETYGNVVAEAMASGLPCVIADGGGSADFVTEGVTGFKCRPFDSSSYVDKIRLLLEDKARAAAIAGNSVAYARNLDWNRLTDIYFSDLEALALPDLSVRFA